MDNVKKASRSRLKQDMSRAAKIVREITEKSMRRPMTESAYTYDIGYLEGVLSATKSSTVRACLLTAVGE